MNGGTMTPQWIISQWTVWCGQCKMWERTSGSKSSCSKLFKKIGWKKIKGQWICPKCAKK